MAFFARFKKDDLRVTAEELGLKITSDMKLIDLRNAILQSDNYEEDFVKQLLSTSKEARERNEELEKEEKQKEKQRQFELEEKRFQLELEEKEKQRQFELEEKRFQLELEEKQRQFELEKLRIEAQNQRERITEVGNPNSNRLELQKMLPKFSPEKDDITLFLTLFERQAKFLAIPVENWASLIIGVLPSEIGCIIARESEDSMKDYERVKEVLLNRFKMTPEKLHKLFITLNKDLNKTWYDFYYELKSYLEGWIQGLNITTLEQFKDLIIAEQMKKRCPTSFKEHHIEEWALLISPVELAKKLDNFENIMDQSSKKFSVVRSKRFQEQNNDFSQVKRNSQEDFNTRINTDGRKSPNSELFDTRRKLSCYVCGSLNHLKPQCPELKKSTAVKATINKIGELGEEVLLSPYTLKGKVNGIELPILRDTGATIDVICQKYIKPEMLTGETVWVRTPLDEGPKCLPIAKVKIEGKFGEFYAKAAVIRNSLDQGRYLLGNRTAAKINEMRADNLNKVDRLFIQEINAVTTRSATYDDSSSKLNKTIATTTELIEDSENKILPDVENNLSLIKLTKEEMRKAQNDSDSLQQIIKMVQENLKDCDYILENGVLIKKHVDHMKEPRKLLVIPEKYRREILKICHEDTSGHLGVTKTKDALLRYFFWPKCYQDIESYVKSCDKCQRVGKTQDKKKAPLKLVPVIGEIFSKINIDTCGPLPVTASGKRYLVTAICLASKYPDAIPTDDIHSTSIIDALLIIFSRMGFPKEIQCDQGTSFMSNLTSEFFERFGIKVVHSSVYHPQSNPVERFHRSLKRILKVLCIEAHEEWEKRLPAALFALRTVRHETTGFTPAELVHGKNLRTPLTLLYEKWVDNELQDNAVTEYIFKLINRLQRCQEVACENTERAQIRQKHWYDRKAIRREFQIGDLVLVFSTSKTSKMSPQWEGPGEIEKKLSETNYVVKFIEKDKSKVYHINMLKPYYKRPEHLNLILSEEEKCTEIEEEIPWIEWKPCKFDVSELIQEEKLKERLTNEEINQLVSLVCKYSDCFSNEPGKTSLVEHDIKLNTEEPVRARPYRMSPRQTKILEEEVNKMLRMGIIEIGESDFTSPMILVEVEGKDPRPCIDYRRLNNITRTEYFPLPNIEERIETVAAAMYISALDLTKGYWQIPLSKQAQRYAAFVTSFGSYRPLRMPFGLKNAPYYFSKLMTQVLKDCGNFAVPYLDDIAVFSKNFNDHLKHLETVFKRIRAANLKIKASKCQFAQAEVKYLGHYVGQGKRKPSEIKIQVIQKFLEPKTKTELRAFLGLAGYYRQYIPKFSVIAAPLTDLLKGRVKDGMISFDAKCSQAFLILKNKLASHPVLYSPDFNKEFIIQCDASEEGIGVVLSQKKNAEEHPILFLSKKFSEAEKKYSTTEKECAAIIYAIKKLKCYLNATTRFIIQTDHNPLVWLQKNSGNNPRLMRWALALQPLNFKIEHRKGKLHINADSLSRLPTM